MNDTDEVKEAEDTEREGERKSVLLNQWLSKVLSLTSVQPFTGRGEAISSTLECEQGTTVPQIKTEYQSLHSPISCLVSS